MQTESLISTLLKEGTDARMEFLSILLIERYISIGKGSSIYVNYNLIVKLLI